MEQKFDFSKADPLFVEVAKYVVVTGKAQASALQRDFGLGYNRAGRILSQLEATGIVGEAVRCKPRAVLCTAEELEQKFADEIDIIEDRKSARIFELHDLNPLTVEALIPIAKSWCENLKQEFPQFSVTLLDDNTTIRLQMPIKGEGIYALLGLRVHHYCQYKLTSCDNTHNRDMYFLLKDIIPNPTPQKRTYGYGFVDLKTGYKGFSDLIRKLEKL